MAVNPQYLKAVAAASKKYKVPADLLAAQIQAESGWRPDAKSPAGAVGISQFMPSTAKGYGIDPRDPLASIDAQGKMMGSLLRSYKGNVPKALAAYNAGAGAVQKYGGVPPFKETRNYIKNISGYRKNYPGLATGKYGGAKLPLPSGGESGVTFGAGGESTGRSETPPKGLAAETGSPVLGLTPGGLMAAAKAHLGDTTAKSGVSFIEQALAMTKDPHTPPLKLPSGAMAQTQVNRLEMDKNVEDPKLSPSGQGIVNAALKFKGTPYSWGGGNAKGPSKGIGRGAGTTGFDCSGLVQYAVAAATGKKVPRVASAQYAASTKVPLKAAKPGDIVAFGTPSNIHHIGIYIGDGKFIQAPKTGDVVKVSSLAGRSDMVGVGRF